MRFAITTTVLIAAAVLAATVPLAAPAQTVPAGKGPAPQELSATVPELNEFHGVIYRLWHEAWPKKDLAMLTSLLPEIEAGASKLEKASLPGILRDKQGAWDAGVRKLDAIAADYKSAVNDQDLRKTLDAGERLHSQFEALGRIVRPALEEMNAFHRVLYRLYHYELAPFSLSAIQVSAGELQERMAALGAARLPERMQPKQVAFEARRKELGKSVADLAALAAAGRDEKAIRDAVETVHDRYVALDEVF